VGFAALDKLKNGLMGVSQGGSDNTIDINVSNILNANWDLTDEFTIFIRNNYVNNLSNKEFLKIVEKFNEYLKYCIVSFTLPTLTAQETDVVLGGVRRVGVKMSESFRFSITFRDIEGGIFRKYFETIWIAQQFEYFDDIKTYIQVWANNSFMFKSEDCLILSVNPITYTQAGANFTEFTVEFITPTYSDSIIKNYGSNPDYSKSFNKR